MKLFVPFWIPGTSLVAPLDGSGDPDGSLELQLLQEVTDEGGKFSYDKIKTESAQVFS